MPLLRSRTPPATVWLTVGLPRTRPTSGASAWRQAPLAGAYWDCSCGRAHHRAEELQERAGERQRRNHRALADEPRREGPGRRRSATLSRIGGVVVPTNRADADLGHAVKAARDTGAALVVLTSGGADAATVHDRLRGSLPADRLAVVAVGPETPPRARFGVDASQLFEDRSSDTALKRNLGLMLAQVLGWELVLFLDDDVTALSPAQLDLAVQEFLRDPATRAVGWAFEDFPDNSVVRHAFRLAGAQQGTFIGGGALLVRVGVDVPFFPKAYNEDWLFLLPWLADPDTRVVLAGVLRQRPYDPFGKHADAVAQEAGDLLAEGLFDHLHVPGGTLEDAAREVFWRRTVARRRQLVLAAIFGVRAVLRGTDDGCTQREVSRRAVKCLQRALAVLDEAESARWPALLAEWVVGFRHDQVLWRRRLEELPGAGSLPDALAVLGLPAADVLDLEADGECDVHDRSGGLLVTAP